jgi:hypothetical protein
MTKTENGVVRVIGVPRSGTNLAKYLIENHTNLTCRFNCGWWKHHPVPRASHDGIHKTPTLVLFREPREQMASFLKFIDKRPASMQSHGLAPYFLSEPLVLRDPDSGKTYSFANPIKYWQSFYLSAIPWLSSNWVLVPLKILQTHPESILEALKTVSPDFCLLSPPQRPTAYLARNSDSGPRGGVLDPTLNAEEEEKRLTLIQAGFDDAWAHSPDRAGALNLYEALLKASISGSTERPSLN